MKTIDRNTYDSYEMLIELVKPLVNYFKETKNEDLFIDTYKFCNYIINDENYEFGSVVYNDKPWKHTISYNGNYLNEQEIYELLVKFDFVKNQPSLSTKQIDIINHVLKYYYSKSDLFLNEEGKINPQKEVEIPNTGITTSVEEIREIRALLKQLRKNVVIKIQTPINSASHLFDEPTKKNEKPSNENDNALVPCTKNATINDKTMKCYHCHKPYHYVLSDAVDVVEDRDTRGYHYTYWFTCPNCRCLDCIED